MTELSDIARLTPPILDEDPFSEDILRDPYAFFERLRDIAPICYIPTYDCYAIGRHAEAVELVNSPDRFISSAGMGLADIRKPGAWRTRSPISELDPPEHTPVRRALNRILSPAVIRNWREQFHAEAERVVDEILDRREIDAVTDIADRFVLTVFPRVLGVEIPRENLLAIGEMNFNQLGPNNERVRRSVEIVQPILPIYEQSFQRSSMLPGGFGEAIFLAEDAGALAEGTATFHVRGFLRGGTETTIAGIGFALNQLARHSDQWAALRGNDALVRNAFDEAIRFESPAQVLFRTVVAPTTLSGHALEADRKVAYFMGSANRDPRKWADPDRFDITRNTAGVHLAFGGGVHICIGQMIARLEAECMLAAMARRIERIEPNGDPKYRLINTLRTLDTLPLRVFAR